MTGAPISLKEALRVKKLQPRSYRAVIPLDLCFDILAHGGFQTSLVLTAIKQAFENEFTSVDQPHTIDIHLTFLRPTLSGEVNIHFQDVRLGAYTSTYRFTVSQRGKNCLTGFASNANIRKEKGPSYPTRYQLLPPPASVKYEELELNRDANWVLLTNRWYPASPFKASTHVKMFIPVAGTAHPSVMEFWTCPLSQDERFTNEMLGYLVDNYPRMIESMFDEGNSKWSLKSMVEKSLRERQSGLLEDPIADVPLAYPTLSLTLEQKKSLPLEGARWLFLRAETKKVLNGRWDVEVVVCDEHLDVVAFSHQVNLMANLVKRRKKASADASDSQEKGKL